MAGQNDEAECVSLLLANPQIDVKKESNAGDTQFIMAVYNGHLEVVKLLLSVPEID